MAAVGRRVRSGFHPQLGTLSRRGSLFFLHLTQHHVSTTHTYRYLPKDIYTNTMMNRLIASHHVRHALLRSSSRTVVVSRSRLVAAPSIHGIRFFSDINKDEQKVEATTTEEEEEVVVENKFEKELLELKNKSAVELKDLKDQLLRSLAEQENTRRIAKRDVASAKQFAIKSFATALLDTSDNLERALQAVLPEDLLKDTDNTHHPATTNPVLLTLYEGIQMTESGLNKALEKNGLVKFGKVGEIFDPNKHEALFEYPDPTKTPGTVGQIMKAGFLLNERVLRPAEVGVIKK